MKIILASSSIYRKNQLSTLGYKFTTQNPDIDETRHDGEDPHDLVRRLALEKAQAISTLHPKSLVISGDQVATYKHHILGKPLNRNRAIKSLSLVSGGEVVFLSAACIKTASFEYVHIEPTNALFRLLTTEEIETYIDLDRPYDCAGSFRSEKLGLHLLNSLKSDDPSALLGLPLIWVSRTLRKIKINPLK